jgi:tetratricopeptide (TPR) repeat protein
MRVKRFRVSLVVTSQGTKVVEEIKILDVVALAEDLPDHGLRRGEVGTVVERWKDGAYEVEFSSDSGEAYAFAALHTNQLIKLHFNKLEVNKSRALSKEARKLLDEGVALLNSGNEEEAERMLIRAIEADAGSRGVLLNSILKSFTDDINWEDRLPSLRFLFRLAPDYGRGRDNLAITYLNCGVERAKAGDIAAAQVFFNYAIAVDAAPEVASKIRENFAGVLTTLGIKAHKSADYDTSLGFMRMACVVFPTEKTRHNLGLANAFLAWSHIGKREYEEAIAFFEAAEETGLILPELLNDYAIALVFENRLDEAALAFERALRLDPDNSLVKENLTKLNNSEPFDSLIPEEIKAEYIYIPTGVQQYQLAA